jgi:plastocyanin
MRRPWVPLVACVALITGCGDEGDDGSEGPGTTVPAGKELRVTGDEYSFAPARVTVTGPGRVKVTLRNAGSLAHNLKLIRDGREVGGTPTFQGGETRSGSAPLERGSYEMVCTVGNHADLGMVGQLEVR